MKLGTENKRQTAIAVVLLVVAVVLLIRAFSRGGEDTAAPPTATATPARSPNKTARKTPTMLAHSLDPTLRFDLLRSSEDVTYKGNGRNIFSSEAPPPDIPKPIKQVVDTTPPPPPPPPPIDLKFYGYTNPRNGSRQIFLLKGEDIFLAKQGDIVDHRYKIVHIGPTSVDVQDVLTNNTQTIPLSAG